jgi:two-component system, response regulator PdtaR
MDQKVCVVEDEPFTRIDAVSVLEEAGFPVEQFATGDRAACYLEASAPDVVFLFTDVMMPGRLNGAALARLVDERWPWIRIVVTSSAAISELPDLPNKAKFMPKPWRPAELLAHAIAARQER